jgi:hypothetical protein
MMKTEGGKGRKTRNAKNGNWKCGGKGVSKMGAGREEYPKLTTQWEPLTASTTLHLSASTVRKFPKYRNLDLRHLRFGPGSSLGHHDKSGENGNDEKRKADEAQLRWGSRKR